MVDIEEWERGEKGADGEVEAGWQGSWPGGRREDMERERERAT